MKSTKNVWEIDLKPEFPKKPDITIVNIFKKNIKELSVELMLKIKSKIKMKTSKKIVPQNTLDYIPNLKLLKPSFVVHGDDWKRGIQKN